MPFLLDYEPQFVDEPHVVAVLQDVKATSTDATLFHNVRLQFKILNAYLQEQYQATMTRDEFRHIVWRVIQVPLS